MQDGYAHCSLSGDSPVDGHIHLSSFSTMNVKALVDIRGCTSFCAFVIFFRIISSYWTYRVKGCVYFKFIHS